MYGLRGLGDISTCGPQPSVNTSPFTGLPDPTQQIVLLQWLQCMGQSSPQVTAPGPTTVLAPPPSAVSVAPPSFSLLNRTQSADFTNGGTFKVGDQYQAMVANVAANQPVTVHAIHDGTDLGSSVVGNTGDAGIFTLNGSMDESAAGHWDETWNVPGGFYSSFLPNLVPLNARVSFTVQGAPAPTPPASSGSGSSAGGTSAGSQAQGSPKLTSTLTLPDFTQGFSFSSIPLWGWAAIAVGGFMLLGGGKR